MKRFLIGAFILSFFFYGGVALAYVASSPNYQLEKDSLNFSGTESSASTNYLNIDTLGEISSGLLGGSNYNASTGYRFMNLDPVESSATVLGCTDPQANNYNSLATSDDGSCTYGPGGGATFGCTDSQAINYNAQATQDDGSCLYVIPNVKNFQAHYRSEQEAIRLTWENPLNYNFKTIVIVRGDGTYPLNPADGLLIYEGRGQITWDYNVEEGTRYYYTAFVKSWSDQYSSGVVATEVVPFPSLVLGCTDPRATNYNSLATQDDGTCAYSGDNFIYGCTNPRALNYDPQATRDDGSCVYSPFVSTTTEIENIGTSKEWDIRFVQPQERVKTFDNKMRVWILGNKDLTILFNYNLAPKTLKTIGVTLTDPIEKTKTFSFLMHQSKDGLAYEATIAPLLRDGVYPVDIYIIGYEGQAVRHIKGKLIVSGFEILPMISLGALAVGFLPFLYNLLTALYQLFSYFFGRRKNDNPWGTVYDSVTKRPLDPVYLTVVNNDKEISTAITDIDGRFSFFLPAGEYSIKANKTHYRFPSERLLGRTTDELYDHLYFGDKFESRGEAIINLNVPMDPIDFDWNEFAKTKKNFFEFYQRRSLWANRLYRLIFVSGFLLTVYVCVVSLSWWNAVMLLLYFGITLINRFWHGYHRPLQVIKSSTGEPLPFAIIRVFLPDLNQQIKYTVADKFGRFYLLVRPGVYYYTVEEKQLDGTYLKVFQSSPVNLPKGVLTQNIYVK